MPRASKPRVLHCRYVVTDRDCVFQVPKVKAFAQEQ